MKLFKMCYTVGLDDLPTAYPNTLHEPTKALILCCYNETYACNVTYLRSFFNEK